MILFSSRNQRSKEYYIYHNSPQWQVTRASCMLRARGVCEECKRVTAREVHIKKYPLNLFEITPDLCEALCVKCHRAADQTRRLQSRQFQKELSKLGAGLLRGSREK